MVNLVYEETEIRLRRFHLKGLGMLSGLEEREALDFYDRVELGLEIEGDERIRFDDLIDYAKDYLKDEETKHNFSVLGKYLDSCFKRVVNEPFFVFIGGAASTGKDTLVGDLVHYLGCYGVDRIVPTDLLREASRTELLHEYGSEEEVPDGLDNLFKALYQVDEEGARLQVEYVRKNIKSYFVDQAIRETKTWMHPLHILYGSHVMPHFEEEVCGRNKLVAILNPPKNILRARICARQERERWPAMNEEDRGIRIQECEKTIEMRDYIEREARRYGCELIEDIEPVKVLHSFGRRLVHKLQKILNDSYVSI